MDTAATRTKYLAALDAAYAKLRAVVADPKWTNLNYKDFESAKAEVGRRIEMIHRLNSVEEEASLRGNLQPHGD